MPKVEATPPAERRQGRVTSKDVAREAGVSKTTVSYVLNNTPHQSIPVATREAVWEAARRLNYVPSAAARALRLGRSQIVLLALRDWPIGYIVGQLVERLSLELARVDLSLVVVHVDPALRPLAGVLRLMSPAAVIGLAPLSAEDLLTLRSADILVPAVMASGEDSQYSWALNVSQTRMGWLQADHLARTGHRRLGFAMPADPRLKLVADLRVAGFEQACREHQIPAPFVQIVPEETRLAEHAIERWRSGRPPVSGVGAYNDDVALALLAGLHSARLDAPEDLAVVGMDDIPQAKFATPPLTTVSVNHSLIARYLAMTVAREINGEPPPPLPRAALKLVLRKSA